jgi:hypothetical protein
MALRHVRLASLPAFAVLLAAAPAPAQDSTWLRSVRAAAAGLSDRDLARLFAAPAPLLPMVDALLTDREAAERAPWFALARLVEVRRAEVTSLWRDEPGLRAARAELFARLGGDFALDRHLHGDPRERADAETTAAAMRPCELASLEWLLRDNGRDDEAVKSAAVLQRCAARGARTRPSAAIDALHHVHGTPDELADAWLSWTNDSRVTPFALAGLVNDDDPVVRARAMAALRWSQKLPLPIWLRRTLATDPAPNVRTLALEPLTDATVVCWLDVLARGDTDLPRLRDGAPLSPANRARLVRALVAAGLHEPLDPAPRTGPDLQWGCRVFSRGDDRAASRFAAAIDLDERAFVAVLGIAVNAAEPRTAVRALRAAIGRQYRHWTPRSAEAIEAMAPLTIALLDHRDPEVAMAAAAIAELLLTAQPLPALRERVAALAAKAFAADGQSIAVHLEPRGDTCGMRPPSPPYGAPTTFASQIVRAAANSGDLRLFDGLVADWRLHAQSPGVDQHRELLLQCFALMAPFLDETRAGALHALLADEWSTKGAPPGSLTRAVPRLFATVPDALLPWYERTLVNDSLRQACARDLADTRAPLAPDRVIRLLEPLGLRGCPRLYLRVPRLLRDAWQAVGEQRQAAVGLLGSCWQQGGRRILALVRSGDLPRELAAASVIGEATPDLAALAELLPGLTATASAATREFVHGIHMTVTGSPGSELAALQTLATAAAPRIAFAAAERAATLGDAGRALARDTMARLLVDPEPLLSSGVATLALRTGIEPPGLEVLVTRFRRTDHVAAEARLLAEALELRFRGLDPRATKCGRPAEAIGLSHSDVDADTLRTVFADRMRSDLERLLAECSPTTKTSALLLAAEVPAWSERLERLVTLATLDEDPRVRRAAYQALATRDNELWPCAWLAYEAAFDPDPSVRAAVR